MIVCSLHDYHRALLLILNPLQDFVGTLCAITPCVPTSTHPLSPAPSLPLHRPRFVLSIPPVIPEVLGVCCHH